MNVSTVSSHVCALIRWLLLHPICALLQMMKKMYEEGDDEMKRTIAKAWTEGQEKKGLDSF